jgi:hypothetical protein
MPYLINPPNKPGKSPDSSMLLPLKKKQIIVTSGGYNLIQDTLIKQGFENGLSLVYCQPALRCPCPTVPPIGELQFLNFTYSSQSRTETGVECNRVITEMVLTWTFNQTITSATFDSCFSSSISVRVDGPNAIYTIETNHPGSSVDSQPLYYELTVNNEYLFTGYFIIPACT